MLRGLAGFFLQNSSFSLMCGKFFRIQERLKTQSGEENSSSGRFNPVFSSRGALGGQPTGLKRPD